MQHVNDHHEVGQGIDRHPVAEHHGRLTVDRSCRLYPVTPSATTDVGRTTSPTSPVNPLWCCAVSLGVRRTRHVLGGDAHEDAIHERI